jgi:hypothetical protein
MRGAPLVLVACALAARLTCATNSDEDDWFDPPDHFEDDVEEDEPEQAGAAPNGEATRRTKKPRRPLCSSAQREWMMEMRKKFDADAATTAAAGWIVAPPVPRPLRGSAPEPGAYQLHPWGAWVPERLWPTKVRAPFCPVCGTNDHVIAAAARWRAMPRVALGGPTGLWFLDGRRYVCDRHTSCVSFDAFDPKSVKCLPEECAAEFSVRVGRTIVDAKLCEMVVGLWCDFIPSATIAKLLNDRIYDNYLAANARYWAACNAFERPGVEAAPSAAHTLDGHVVRGDAARELNAVRAAAAAGTAAPPPRRPLPLSGLAGLGEAKVRKLRSAGIFDIETLAEVALNKARALQITGRGGANPSRRDSDNAVATLTGWRDRVGP